MGRCLVDEVVHMAAPFVFVLKLKVDAAGTEIECHQAAANLNLRHLC